MTGRIPVLMPVELKQAGNRWRGVAVDLSLGGISIVAENSINTGEKVTIFFSLVDGIDLQAQVEVTHSSLQEVEDRGRIPVIGLTFITMSEGNREKLQEYINEFRYYPQTFRPSKLSGHLREKNLKKAVILLDRLR